MTATRSPMTVTSLETVRLAFARRIADEVLRDLVNTRVFLRTGVNLKQIRPDQLRDPLLIAQVLEALREFGYGVLEKR